MGSIAPPSVFAEVGRHDHCRLGQELDLFRFSDDARGMVYWHPRGWALWTVIEAYLHRLYKRNRYREVKSPQLVSTTAWEKSGHWRYDREALFDTVMDSYPCALKPMSCPAHMAIYNARARTWRELPVRYGELAQCHRYLPRESLQGLLALRAFTRDEGHVFCRIDQVEHECMAFTRLVQMVYKDFGFTDISYAVATRPVHHMGDRMQWDAAEQVLAAALQAVGCPHELLVGEGAFYGPKIVYALTDASGRRWPCGTLQLDFNLAARMDARYEDADGQAQTPVVLHRAVLGSLERFIAILLEHHGGALPVWLAPVQVVVLPANRTQAALARAYARELEDKGFRVEADLRLKDVDRQRRRMRPAKSP